MRTRLPIIKCLDFNSDDTRIIDLDIDGIDKYYTYEIPIKMNLNTVLRNDVTSVRVQAISTLAKHTTTTLQTVNSQKGVSSTGKLMYGTAMTIDDVDVTVAGSKIAKGNFSKKSSFEDNYKGFIDLSDSYAENSKSMTQEIADAYSKIKWESHEKFAADGLGEPRGLCWAGWAVWVR